MSVKIFGKARNKGQTTLEYGLIIAVVIAALVAMGIYMKRGYEGRLRESTDSVGAAFEASQTSAYSETERTGTTVQETTGSVTTSTTDLETVTEKGNEEVNSWESSGPIGPGGPVTPGNPDD